MKIKIKDEETLVKTTEELIHVITNLRKFTKLWEESYGVELKKKKKHYEKRADDLIDRLQVLDHVRQYEVNVVIDGTTEV